MALNDLELGKELYENATVIIHEAKALLVPEGEWTVYPIQELKDATIRMQGHDLQCGRNVEEALKGSVCVAVIFATVGEAIEARIKSYTQNQDYLEAFWCDKLSNLTLEKTVKYICKEIESRYEKEGWTITSMWSPGYCGWPIEDLSVLLDLLPRSKKTVTLSPSMLMHPLKSIAGIIGIGPNVSKIKSGCSTCFIKDKCVYKHFKKRIEKIMPKIIIRPINIEYTVQYGVSLKESLNALHVDFPCGGRGLCGKCLVRLLKGNIAVNSLHAEWLKKKGLGNEWRLACLSHIEEDVEIEICNSDMKILEAADCTDNYIPEEGYGIAIDLGSTTIVAQLVNLNTNSIMQTIAEPNPQVSYGADILSRIYYASANKRNEIELQKCIRTCIGSIVNRLIQNGKSDKLKKIIIAGNTVMHHFFCGLDVAPLGIAPYNSKHNESYTFNSSELGWGISIPCEIEFLPNISHFIGSDILCGIISSGLMEEDSYNFLIDLGTNGEIVVGNREVIICTSTAAGPAFEGINISCGMRAESGAIYAVEDNSDGHIKCLTINNHKVRGICGSGLIEVVDWLLKKDYIDIAGSPLKSEKEWPSLGDGIKITGKDVREFQLAKAALSTGIEILLKDNNLDLFRVSKVYLTGGLGYYVNISKCKDLGLLQFNDETKILRIQNASLTGCRALLYDSNRDLIKEVLNKAKFCALEQKKDFQKIFCDKLYLDKY